jgi:HEAT repeats/HEAT repeat
LGFGVLLLIVAAGIVATYHNGLGGEPSTVETAQPLKLDTALRNLQDPDPKVRQAAVATLYGLKDRRSVEPLIATLKDADPGVASTAAAALVEMPDDRTVDLLILTLHDPSDQARCLAARSLGRIKNKRAIEPLTTALTDHAVDVRREAVLALAEFNDAQVIKPIIGALNDDSPIVRLNAAKALGEIKDPRLKPLVLALQDKNISVRVTASNAVEAMQDQLDDAMESVTDYKNQPESYLDIMTTEELAAVGEVIIFGEIEGYKKRGIGKGQCPLCQTFKAGDIGDRAPKLLGITRRAAERIKEPKYLHPDTVQTEAFPGSGRATTAMEYLAESNVCPSCYVAAGFGERGTNDRSSPAPKINKPPISLSINEMIMVNTWLYRHDGNQPPPVTIMRAAYEKFIPVNERVYETVALKRDDQGGILRRLALSTDTPEEMIKKTGCAACHKIPDIGFAHTGPIGPLLIDGTNARNRIRSTEYQAAVKAGLAHATTPKEYVIESIIEPSAFIVRGFPRIPDAHYKLGKSLMPSDYGAKFTYEAASKLADFLLTQTAEKATMAGVDRNPFEKEGSLYK